MRIIFYKRLWSRFLTIAGQFFFSPKRGTTWAALSLLVLLLLSVNGMNFVASYAMRDFMTALEQSRFNPEQAKKFFLLGTILAGLFGLASIGEAFAYYFEQRLGLLWRQWLTRRLLDRYLAHRASSRETVNQAVDNPDERISEDAKTFTISSLSFIVLIVNGILTLLAFLGVLWSITPWLVLTAVLYAAAGSLGTILLGRRLVLLNNHQSQKEADFRFALVGVRQHNNGEQPIHWEEEKPRLLERFKALVENFRGIIGVTRNVGIFTKEYNHLIQIIPAVVAAPFYIWGHAQFGTIAQSAMAFGQVVGAFSLIVTKFQELSTFAAVVNRLGSMWEATEPAQRREEAEGKKTEEAVS
jgi:putative ATP-binding cassette transporter